MCFGHNQKKNFRLLSRWYVHATDVALNPGRGGPVFLRARAENRIGLSASQRRQRKCRERPSACVAPSVSSSVLSRCWSTCATVRTASFGQARHGAAPHTFPRKPSAWRVPTRSIPGRVTPGPVSTIISVRPVGQLFAGPARPAPRGLASRLGHLTIRHSPPHRYPFGKNDDTRGHRRWRMWIIGTHNRASLRRVPARKSVLAPRY
jgi:hypothetical protein